VFSYWLWQASVNPCCHLSGIQFAQVSDNMVIRYSKIALVAASCAYLLLVVLNNLTDYGSNFRFVEAVLTMGTTFQGNSGMWRAIESPWMHHLFYWTVIAWEAVACLLLGLGCFKLWQFRSESAASFNQSKDLAIAGLTLALLLWFLAFLTVGGEWFLMWQSKIYNGQAAAHRMFAVMGICLLFLAFKDEEAS